VYIHHFENVVFRRKIKDPVRSDDEEKMKPEEMVLVTQEANGCAVWYKYEDCRIIAFCSNRDVAIQRGATIEVEIARERARTSSCEFSLPNTLFAEIPAEEVRQ
jgi:hypothetical protein